MAIAVDEVTAKGDVVVVDGAAIAQDGQMDCNSAMRDGEDSWETDEDAAVVAEGEVVGGPTFDWDALDIQHKEMTEAHVGLDCMPSGFVECSVGGSVALTDGPVKGRVL